MVAEQWERGLTYLHMSFIMIRLRCKKCAEEFNVSLGTFGYGMPEKCHACGTDSENFEKIADEWTWDKKTADK